MKSIRREQHLITLLLLAFLVGMGVLLYRLQKEAAFYISHASTTSLGLVYDRKGDVLFDPKASKETYAADHFLDIDSLIGDDSGQMTNTLVAKNKELLTNFSFMLGEVQNGEAAIHTSLDHAVSQQVYAAFGSKNGSAVAYNYLTGEVYVCFSKPSVNILNQYADIETLEEGSLLCLALHPTIPGSMQKISTTAAAIETMGYDKLMTKQYNCTGTYINQNGQAIKCHKESGHGMQTVTEAFSNSCNPFFAQLVEDTDWKLSDITAFYKKMGYAVNGEGGSTLTLDGINCFTASTTLTDAKDFDTQWGCMGQGETLVSPIQMMTWQSAIANATGKVTQPYLISHVTTANGGQKTMAETTYGEAIFTAQTAAAVREIMLENGRNRYSDLLAGSTVGVKSGTAQHETANGKIEHALLTGFVDDPNFPIAFCVEIADRQEGEVSTSQIVRTMLGALRETLAEN